jgi:hypothetical protein
MRMKLKSTLTKTYLQSNADTQLQSFAGTTSFKPCTLSAEKAVALVIVLSLFLLSVPETFAQIAQRGIATTGFGTTSTLSLAMPASVVQGDVMIAAIAHVIPSGSASNATCSGWTLINGLALNGVTGRRYGTVLYKVAGAAESGPYIFSTSVTSNSAGTIVAFSGVDVTGATPFDVTPGTISYSGSPGFPLSVSAISTTTSNAAVVMMALGVGATTSTGNWSGWITTSPGALDEISDFGDANTAYVGAAWATKATAGSTGAGIATSYTASYLGGILLALKRATATGIEDLKENNGMILSNYPNPFIGNTAITCTLPSDGHVTLTIRNFAGQVLKTIVNEMKTKGDYTLNIEAGDLQSGIYMATLSLKTNGKEMLKTIRLVKGK